MPMPGWLNRIAKRRMLKARAEGALGKFAGEDEPLPVRPGDIFIDPGEAIGFRIMAETGALPDEISLREAVQEAKARYSAAADETERRAAMAEIARLEQRCAVAEEARRRFVKN
ncbi:hypothetical protein DEA8626_03731 [Defluviimonas aquaemixtae]|uniref:DnaJ homologue subfamily C member 28 conserved domain-containing protein n=1 Tax=Albidovulum aquaemixtae TaxID=1542388 RepID=A0A2R8BMN2_9RHOB|nr:DnaJ family domain-containing protein [Defluviimonas aquaemixtae]SPH24695.1 hypothetical protein DEA8626_03731 [Defluviimonas aquaemixtae]